MIRCCVAEPLVRTWLGAFPPMITALSHLSRFTNFGCRVCVFKVFAGSRRLPEASYPHARERNTKEEKGREENGKQKRKIIIINIINNSSSSCCCYYMLLLQKWKKLHNLEVSRQRFAACVVPQIFLLNLFVLSSLPCIILGRMSLLHKQELFCSTLAGNCAMKTKDRSYYKKTSSHLCQDNFQNGCHFTHQNIVMHRGQDQIFQMVGFAVHLVQLPFETE